MHHIERKWIRFSFQYRSDSSKITGESGYMEGGVASWAWYVNISSGTIIKEGSDSGMLGGSSSEVEGGEAFCVEEVYGGRFVVLKDGEDGWDVALLCCLVEGSGGGGFGGGDVHFDVEFLVGRMLGVFGFQGFSGFEFR